MRACVGKKVLEKFEAVRKAMKDLNADSLMITSLEDVACECCCFYWHYSHLFHHLLSNSHARTFTGLLNLRGSDFDYLPVFFANGIITEKECHLFLMNHQRGKSNKVTNHFQIELIDVDVKEYNETLTGINMVVS